MPLITNVGRKSYGTRLLLTFIYSLLILGSITMIYPFMLMVSTSLSGKTDFNEYQLIPKYIYNDEALYQKFVGEKDQMPRISFEYQNENLMRPQDIKLPKIEINDKLKSYVNDFNEFREKIDNKYTHLYHSHRYDRFYVSRKYWKWIKKKYDSLEKINKTYDESLEKLTELDIPYKDMEKHRWLTEESLKIKEFEEFQKTLEPHFIKLQDVNYLYVKFLKWKYPNIDECNKDLDKDYKSFYDAQLSPNIPSNPKELKLYEEFIRKWYPIMSLKIRNADKLYQGFIKEKYKNIATYNKYHTGNEVKSFENIRIEEESPFSKIGFDDWAEFIEKKAPIQLLELNSPENQYRKYLKETARGLQG